MNDEIDWLNSHNTPPLTGGPIGTHLHPRPPRPQYSILAMVGADAVEFCGVVEDVYHDVVAGSLADGVIPIAIYKKKIRDSSEEEISPGSDLYNVIRTARSLSRVRGAIFVFITDVTDRRELVKWKKRIDLSDIIVFAAYTKDRRELVDLDTFWRDCERVIFYK